ncbi:hypothetical protein [Amycolatopsis thermophila]|uniref:Minor tail protein n=1 Tax=Amycolatopsis thermophila TaxID=206084 RepID=A0ABU0ERQ7_9PSEU|nr:hypothetical protein [Amycolatopsis thermophila]MDQ0377968.1 hypothetical protein [Amycolatopsis thermophila]
MQLATNTDLAAAVAAPDVLVEDLLEFDWNRDGAYSHAWSDLSFLATSITDTAATIVSDLPEQVNTLTGASSAELQVTLGGAKFGDPDVDAAWNAYLAEQGIAAHQLFSPWWTASPLFEVEITGVPMRYSRTIATAAGDITVRQFTGWLRDFTIDRTNMQVKINASDIVDLQGRSITLPLWALSQDIYNAQVAVEPTARPISATWVVEEALRQAGRPSGPATAPNAIAYVSCNGAILPSFGYGSCADSGEYANDYEQALSTLVPSLWEDGKYGLATVYNPVPATGAGLSRIRFRANAVALVPTATTSQGPATITVGVWVESNGEAVITATPETYSTGWDYLVAALQLDDDYDTAGNHIVAGGVSFHVFRNGQFYVRVKESTNLSGTRSWMWDYRTPLPAGWHYIHTTVRFTNSSITAQSRVDGAVVATTSSTVPAAGFRYAASVGINAVSNVVLFYPNIPTQHFQICHAQGTALDYVPGQEHPPTRDGRPLSVVTPTLSELSWIPDRYDKPAWDVLKEVAASEFGALYTDEYGTVHYSPHYELRNTVPADVANARVIDDDDLLDFVVMPSVDQYRNALSLSGTMRHQVVDIVYRPQDAKQFYTPNYFTAGNEIALSEVVALDTKPRQIVADIPGYTTDRPLQTEASAVYKFDPSIDASVNPHDGWWYTVRPRADQRSFDLIRYGGTFEIYWGAYKGATRVSGQIAGRRYSERSVTRVELRNEAEIAAKGYRVLTLPDNDWRQTAETISAIGQVLLDDIATPAPLIDGIRVTADPRLQLRDILKLTSDEGITGTIYGQVIGIRRESGAGGAVDTLTLRVLGQPGAAVWDDPDSGWDVGRWAA